MKTIPKLSDLTPEQRRALAAEALGWKSPNHPDSLSKRDGWWSQYRGVWWISPNGKDEMISSVPNPDNDANDALKLVEHLQKAAWRVTIEAHGDFRVWVEQMSDSHFAEDEISFSRAITSAFLLASNLAEQ